MKAWLIFAAAPAWIALGAIGFWKAFRVNITGPVSLAIWTASLILGFAAGFTVRYSLDERTRVFGFPLPAAVFQRQANGAWLDYVGPLTLSFACLNAVIATGVMLCGALTLRSYLARKRSAPVRGA